MLSYAPAALAHGEDRGGNHSGFSPVRKYIATAVTAAMHKTNKTDPPLVRFT